MKKHYKISIALAAFLFTIAQIYISMSIFKTEQQKYKVLHSFDEFEIRFYPSATLATVEMNVNSYKDLSATGFRTLAAYIFGANEANKKIAMTAPVHMDIKENGSSMSFVMPEGYCKDNLPKPKDAKIHISKTEDEYIAAIKFGAYASDKKIMKYTKKLDALLFKNHIAHRSNFRFLGYNPPYQFFGRRNEIIVSIEWNEKIIPTN